MTKIRSANTLKIGFIGGGLNSAVGMTHKIACSMDGRWRLEAGCFSTSTDINRRTGELWNVNPNRIYPSWRALLDAETSKLDALAIITPTPSHADIVIEALKRDYAVICEKALAISVAEGKRIRRAVEKNKGFLAVTYNYTGYPMIRELQRWLEQGRLGKLNQIHIEMPQEGYARLGKNNVTPHPQAWRLIDHAIPTLSLDLGVHLHQMIDFFSGEKPLEVMAINDNFGAFKGIVDNTMCLARYTGGLRCQLWFGKTALGHSNGLRVRIYGTKGAAEWFQMRPETLTLHDNKGSTTIIERSSTLVDLADQCRYTRFKAGHPAGFIEAFANQYNDLAESVIEFQRTGEFSSPWVFGADIAVQGLRMLEAIAKSAKTKSWQPVQTA